MKTDSYGRDTHHLFTQLLTQLLAPLLRPVAVGAAVLGTTLLAATGAQAGLLPQVACDMNGIGSMPLVSDLPTLATTNPPNDTSVTVTSVTTGTTSTTGGVPYCLVKLRVQPAINIWVGLPMEGRWNGRLQSEGGGGYAGFVGVAVGSIANGYVGVQTDTGHAGNPTNRTNDGDFGMLTPVPNGAPNTQLQTDFAYRSLHLMAALGKQLAQNYYGQAPTYAYWNGCSTGGRQGLRMAQQFPQDYDGVLAGAPAIHWDRFQAYQIWPQVAMRQDVGRVIPAPKLTLATNAAVAACDAIDGVVDGLLTDPRQCRYDPRTDLTLTRASCAPNDNTCLRPNEAAAIQKIWGGAVNTKGKLLWPGVERGATLNNLAGNTPFGIAVNQPKYWVYFDPAWDWSTALNYGNYEAFFKKTMQMVGPLMASESPDLTAFRDRGGKILMWHGWSDPLIMPQGTTSYYEAVTNFFGGDYAPVQQWFRAFMAPGVGHCSGGGPMPQNLFQTVVNWVENGQAPNTVLASRTLSGGVVQTRPLCPYPTVAKYSGNGSTNVAANFSCAAP